MISPKEARILSVMELNVNTNKNFKEIHDMIIERAIKGRTSLEISCKKEKTADIEKQLLRIGYSCTVFDTEISKHDRIRINWG